MTEAKLYFFPGTCAQVTAVALEETGIDYDLRLADLRTAETKEAYKAINPEGKVPALVIDDHVLTENPAILWFLDQRKPGKLFPRSGDQMTDQKGLSDVVWCGSTLHPMVRQVRMPQQWTVGDPQEVARDGTAKLRAKASDIEQRVNDGRWWYGDGWSIVDTYVWWCFRNAQRGSMDLSDFPGLLGFLDRVDQRPSTKAVIARQTALGVEPIPTSHKRS